MAHSFVAKYRLRAKSDISEIFERRNCDGPGACIRHRADTADWLGLSRARVAYGSLTKKLQNRRLVLQAPVLILVRNPRSRDRTPQVRRTVLTGRLFLGRGRESFPAAARCMTSAATRTHFRQRGDGRVGWGEPKRVVLFLPAVTVRARQISNALDSCPLERREITFISLL